MPTKVTLVKNPHSTLPAALDTVEDASLEPHVFVFRTENHEVIVDAKSGTLHKRRRLKFEPIPSYGTLMTWADFLEGIAVGDLDSEDGEGDYATATEVSNVAVSLDDLYNKIHHSKSTDSADIIVQKLKPPHAWATHVHWCNK